jgi:malonate transporter and related proteins
MERLAAFGGGSALCFMAVFASARLSGGRPPGAAGMQAAAATMTNTGFVALPVLQALYGPAGVLPAAIATVSIAVAMFPPLIVLLEAEGFRRTGPLRLVNVVLINPVMLSTLLGLAWSALHLPLPSAVTAYLSIFADALTPCALFAIGLGLSLSDSRALFRGAIVLTMVKLLVLPLVLLCIAHLSGLGHLSTVVAVICAAVPTAKTA